MYPPHRETAQTRAALSKRALVLKTSIGARIDFQDAVAAGLGVTEYAKSSAAGDELRNLYADIVRTLNAK
jgi:cellulose biosynthesis protein BcsQ